MTDQDWHFPFEPILFFYFWIPFRRLEPFHKTDNNIGELSINIFLKEMPASFDDLMGLAFRAQNILFEGLFPAI